MRRQPARTPVKTGVRAWPARSLGGKAMAVFEIAVEPKARRRRKRRPLSAKKRAAALFRIWHGVRDLIVEAERLNDSELVHFLAVAQLLVEERATALTTAGTAFENVDTSLPN